jgi:hypothetical protein
MVIKHFQQHTKNPWIFSANCGLKSRCQNLMMTLLLHICGLTRAGSSVSLEDKCVQAIADAASEVNPDVIVFCHGHLNL